MHARAPRLACKCAYLCSTPSTDGEGREGGAGAGAGAGAGEAAAGGSGRRRSTTLWSPTWDATDSAATGGGGGRDRTGDTDVGVAAPELGDTALGCARGEWDSDPEGDPVADPRPSARLTNAMRRRARVRGDACCAMMRDSACTTEAAAAAADAAAAAEALLDRLRRCMAAARTLARSTVGLGDRVCSEAAALTSVLGA